jgi:peptidyl-prolyl cis-trans isomerase B (cyclophilin B)
MKSITLAGAIAGGLLLAGCGSSGSGGATVSQNQPTQTPTATTASCATPPPITASPQVSKYHQEPKLTIARTTYTAKIVTNCGTITIAMNGKKAPHTVNSFNFLAGKGYFTDTPCHRITTIGIYVLQCGDPTGTGYGGPGYTIPDENLAGATYPIGTVAMGNGGPDTGGSQFFIVYGNSALGANYTPFGRVTSGLDVVKKVAAAGSTPPGDGKPNQPIVIERFTVSKG